MKKYLLITKDLMTNTAELRRKLEGQPEHISYKKSLLKILTEMEELLSEQPIDLDKLGKAEFGIFRTVTDSESLEESPIGKELMSYLKEFYLLRQAIEESHEN